MSFFKKRPNLRIALWSVFGFGGVVMVYNAIFDHGFDAPLLTKAGIGIAVAAVMIGYAVRDKRANNAKNQ